MQKQSSIPWHTLDEKSALAELETIPAGLSDIEAAARLEAVGPNSLGESAVKSPIAIFIDQFRDFMIGVLLAAAVISGFIGEAKDTLVIMVIVVLNAVIGFVQEYRSEKAMEALRGMSAPRAAVSRDGALSVIDAAGLVPGDIVEIKAGAVVPADLRLLETTGLMVDESALTGESVSAEKTPEALIDKEPALGDRVNLAYSGTIVTGGHARGVVVGTGADSQLGRIAELVETGESRTPLQKRLARFGRTLALAVLAISAVVFLAGVVRGEDPSLMLLTAISLSVAAIPEALPAVVTVSLALGAQQLAKNAALIRRLPAVETLGSVTFICSDKTGTLTKNEMTATELYAGGRFLGVEQSGAGVTLRASGEAVDPADPEFRLLWAGLRSSNNASVEAVDTDNPKAVGDPTEIALALLGRRAGPEESWARVAEIPFDSKRKRMTTVHRPPNGVLDRDHRAADHFISFTKGAFDVLFAGTTTLWTGTAAVGLAKAEREEIEATAEKMAADGLRVLALTCRFWREEPELDQAVLESGLILLGLVGLMDPPRAEAVGAVELSKHAGITPVMITGDHPSTARRIAQDLEITEDGRPVVTGAELERLDDDNLRRLVREARVYARVAPEHKIKIVKALQANGELVAMTGDGVNDAPALKSADIGVAMGITGTDVAKEASDLVLLDDDFATIVRAVAGGRRIYDNIRRFIKYTLTSNTAEILVMLLAPFIGLPIPLLPIHILWINLVTDGLPGLALAVEGPESQLMDRGPRDPRESVFARGLWQHLVWVGILMAAVSLFSQAWWLGRAGAWQTVIFTVLALSQMGHALAVRSETDSLFFQGPFTNPFLVVSILLTLGLQLAIIYTPVLQGLFRTEALTATELAAVVALSTIVFIAVEFEKLVKRRGARRQSNSDASESPVERSSRC